MKITALLSLALAALTLAPGAQPAATAADSPADETPAQRDARMAWFREARFGMFIHWGVYSVPAGEYQDRKNLGEWYLEETKMPVSEYEKFAQQFNPVKFDATEWVRMAKDAGMKYIVITSKHHDGLGMFRSQLTDWCIKRTPFQRDPLKELAAACQAAGIKLCFYHSIMDWHHPDWGTRRKWNDLAPSTPPDMDRYVAYMKGQLKELLTGYGPIGILWFDGEWESPWTHERGVDLYNYVRSLQPEIIINNRVGKARAGMAGMDKGKERIGDYGTPEQTIPPTGFGPGVDWESCMTMNGHWGYNKNDQNWKSAQTLVRNLIDCASKGGNYLLNIGPTSEGLFPPASVERLAAIGKWTKVNSEAIYGTTASPFKKLAWGRATQKPGKLYLHVFDWPKDGLLEVPIANPIKHAVVLGGSGTVLTVTARAGADAPKNCLRVPATAPDPIATVIAVDLDGPVQVVAAANAIRQAADGTLVLKATDAELVGGTINLETKGNGEPNIGSWINDKDYVRWPVTITKPGTFEVAATFACAPGSEGSEVVFSVGDNEYPQTVPATQGWDDFTTEIVGEVPIDKTGSVDCVLKARSMPHGAVVNLRSITFKPVN